MSRRVNRPTGDELEAVSGPREVLMRGKGVRNPIGRVSEARA